jgi:hypothetical protein
MTQFFFFLCMIIVLTSCYTPRENQLFRNTTGSPYNKSGGKMRERSRVPSLNGSH